MSSRIEINGEPPGAEALAQLAQVNYGHFTTLQVRDRAARGFDLHLDRLDDATRRMFGTTLDRGRVRAWVRRVLDGAPASLRITVFSLAFDRERPERSMPVDVLVAAGPGRSPVRTPLRVHARIHERVLPGIKHVGTLDLHALRREARLAGFDDVLLTRADGAIAEGSTWNAGFFDGRDVVWPDAPALAGVTAQLIARGLAARGIGSRHRRVEVAGLGGFAAAFATNTGSPVRPIAAVGEVAFGNDPALMELLEACHDEQSWQSI